MTSISSVRILGTAIERSVRAWPVVAVLYLVSLAIVLPVALAFRATLAGLVGDMPAFDELLPAFSSTVFGDMLRVHGDAFSAFVASFVPVAMVSMIVHAVLGFGVAAVVDTDGTLTTFLTAVGSFAGRALRLLIIIAVAGGILIALWTVPVGMLFGGIVSGDAAESDYLAAIVLGGLLLGAPVAIIILTMEYARVLVVRQNRTSMFRSAWQACVFVVLHPVRMLTLHGTVFVLILVAAAAYWLAEGAIGMTSVSGVILVALLQQAFVVFRVFARVWNTANAVQLSAQLAPLPQRSSAPVPSDLPAPMRVPEPAPVPKERRARRPSGRSKAPRTGRLRGTPQRRKPRPRR